MIDSLAARGDTAACTAIGNSLASPHAAVRREAIDALGRMGEYLVRHTLRPRPGQLHDTEESRALESALVSLPGRRQTDRAIITALKKSSGSTRACLITALARREGPAANPCCSPRPPESDPAAAKAALRALVQDRRRPGTHPVAGMLTRTGDAEVRAEAESASAGHRPRLKARARRSAAIKAALGWAQSDDSRICIDWAVAGLR